MDIISIKSIGDRREIIPVASDGAQVRNIVIIREHSHEPGQGMFHHHFKDHIRLTDIQLRIAVGMVVDHDRHGSFANCRLIQICNTRKRIYIVRLLGLFPDVFRFRSRYYLSIFLSRSVFPASGGNNGSFRGFFCTDRHKTAGAGDKQHC